MALLVRSERRGVLLHLLLSAFFVRRLFQYVRNVSRKLPDHLQDDVLNDVGKAFSLYFGERIWLIVVLDSLITFGIDMRGTVTFIKLIDMKSDFLFRLLTVDCKLEVALNDLCSFLFG